MSCRHPRNRRFTNHWRIAIVPALFLQSNQDTFPHVPLKKNGFSHYSIHDLFSTFMYEGHLKEILCAFIN